MSSLFNRAGVFGPSESGKSFLVHRLVLEFAQKYKTKSLILDPHTHEWHRWPTEAVGFITEDEKKFWPVVWQSKACIVVVEEASSTIARNRDLIPLFTRLRHQMHRLIVIGHSGMDLLPVMRQQFNQLYLFRQSIDSAKVWANEMTEPKLRDAVTLKQFEFLSYRMFQTPVKMKLPAPK